MLDAFTGYRMVEVLDAHPEFEEKLQARNAMSLEYSFLADAGARGHETAYLSFLNPGASEIPTFNEQSFIATQESNWAETLNQYLGFWSLSLTRVLPGSVFRAVETAALWAARPLTDRSGENDWRTYQSLNNSADRLRSLESYDSSLIVIVADHGGSPVAGNSMGGLFELRV